MAQWPGTSQLGLTAQPPLGTVSDASIMLSSWYLQSLGFQVTSPSPAQSWLTFWLSPMSLHV